MPQCVACQEDKPESDFRIRADKNGYRLPRCRLCERKLQNHYYYKAKNEQPFEWRLRCMQRNVSGHITALWLHSQMKLQDWKCALTGRPIDLLTCEVDHVVPRTRGGGDALDNLRLVCTRANEAKGNMTDAEFFELCAEVLRKSSEAQPEIIGRAIMNGEHHG